jgi:hypothetical protein
MRNCCCLENRRCIWSAGPTRLDSHDTDDTNERSQPETLVLGIPAESKKTHRDRDSKHGRVQQFTVAMGYRDNSLERHTLSTRKL